MYVPLEFLKFIPVVFVPVMSIVPPIVVTLAVSVPLPGEAYIPLLCSPLTTILVLLVGPSRVAVPFGA